MRVVVRARRMRRWALVVPLLMSALLVLVLAELVLRQAGVVLVCAWIGTAGLALSSAGERGSSRLLLGARAPHAHQRYTLAAVAEVLLVHGREQGGPRLLVGRGRQPAVHGFGRGTLVVTRGFVEHVRCGQLSARLAAAAIVHETTVMRAGLTRTEPALQVLLAPWRIWLSFLTFGWGLVAAALPLRLMQACLLICWGVGLWLGHSEHPIHYGGSTVLTVAFLTWLGLRSWQRARDAVGDVGLIEAGLGQVFADFLETHFTDDHALDRAVRLRATRSADAPGTRRPGATLTR